MAKPDTVFVYVGTYRHEGDALGDFDVVKDLHSEGAIGTFDAAVVTKDPFGNVHVHKEEMATRHGAWGGAAAGALLGLLFPPAIIGTALAGAAAGGVSGHLWRGMSRGDVKDLGEIIDEGQAAVVVVAESRVAATLEKAGLRADKHVSKELDLSPKEIDKAIREAAGEIA